MLGTEDADILKAGKTQNAVLHGLPRNQEHRLARCFSL
jgi:hypothetical protein